MLRLKNEPWKPFFTYACLSIFLTSILYALWLPATFRTFTGGIRGSTFDEKLMETPAVSIGFGADFFESLISHWTTGGRFMPLVWILLIAGLAWLAKTKKTTLVLIATWLAVPCLIVAYMPGSSLVHYRYLIFGLPAICLILAASLQGVFEICRKGKWSDEQSSLLVAGIAVVALLGFLLYPSLRYFPHNGQHPKYKHAVDIFIEFYDPNNE